MADLATPSAATMSTVNAGADPVPTSTDDSKKKDKVEKPEKPDEAEFKATVAKAEKEHAAVMEKMVTPRAPLGQLNQLCLILAKLQWS